MDALRIAASVLVPWLFGSLLLAVLPRARPADAPGEAAWTLGAGYLLGAFVLTLWMRALSLTGMRLHAAIGRIATARAGRRARGDGVARRGASVAGRAARAVSTRVGTRVRRCVRARTLVDHDRLDGVALHPARDRGVAAAALPVGRMDPVGDQGARLVRARTRGSVWARQPMVRGARQRLLRRIAVLSADGTPAAGVDLPHAGPMGRRAHELAVVADAAGTRARDLRRPALHGRGQAHSARRCISGHHASAARHSCRACRLRRSRDGRLLHRGGARDAALGAIAQSRRRVHRNRASRSRARR